MHWKQLTNQDYIGAYALLKGEDLTVTITSVRKQEIKSSGGRDQECIVAKLDGQKPLILNMTNCKTIAKLYGNDVDGWAGKSITLYASTTSLAGEQVECLRIRPTAPNVVAKKRSLNEDRFGKALVSIETGEFSIAQLLEKYELTAEQQARLPKQLEAGEAA